MQKFLKIHCLGWCFQLQGNLVANQYGSWAHQLGTVLRERGKMLQTLCCAIETHWQVLLLGLVYTQLKFANDIVMGLGDVV